MADARGADPCTFLGGRDTGNSADTGKPWRRRRSKPSRRSYGDVRLFATRPAEISSGRSAEEDHARSRSHAVNKPPRSSLPRRPIPVSVFELRHCLQLFLGRVVDGMIGIPVPIGL